MKGEPELQTEVLLPKIPALGVSGRNIVAKWVLPWKTDSIYMDANGFAVVKRELKLTEDVGMNIFPVSTTIGV